MDDPDSTHHRLSRAARAFKAQALAAAAVPADPVEPLESFRSMLADARALMLLSGAPAREPAEVN
jgi:hypothetical protein